jgi:hypothetical protein|tara:strand:- start:362 stop:937 length:576 start_codon:yes stop_codon:yes gene_type:complete
MSENNYIQQLERAVRVLINSNSNWAMNVSDGDEQFIWDLVIKIESGGDGGFMSKLKPEYNKLVQTSILIDYLEAQALAKNLVISMPLRGWGLGAINIARLRTLVSTLDEPTAIIIKSFSDIDSFVKYDDDPGRYKRMKLVCCGVIDSASATFLSKEDAKSCFDIGNGAGKNINSVKDYHFVTPERVLGDLF